MLKKIFAVLVMAILPMGAASAATVSLIDGGTTTINTYDTFVSTEMIGVQPDNMVTYHFVGLKNLGAVGAALTFDPLTPGITGLKVVWSTGSAGAGNILADSGWVTPTAGVATAIATLPASPGNSAWLTAFWTGTSPSGLYNVQVQASDVSNVPLPAGGILLLTPLLALFGLARRRRNGRSVVAA